jgi:hypothetical protein
LDAWGDDVGAQAVAMTYSPFAHDAAATLLKSDRKVSHIVLHEIDQERILRQTVSEFFSNSTKGSILLVQCDPLAASKRRIEHTKFLIEQERAKFVKDFRQKRESVPGDSTTVEIMSNQENRHVILLVHLPRGNDDGDGKYLVDFDTRYFLLLLCRSFTVLYSNR